jgi:hypothetical protein
MKLAAIYNVWDGVEHLERSVNYIARSVDIIILVYQHRSNYGEVFGQYESNTPLNAFRKFKHFHNKCHFIKYEPVLSAGGMQNEISKRNLGLKVARRVGCTHFFHIDCDEMYYDFEDALRQYNESDMSGSVCKIRTYFGKESYCFEKQDNYFVPFIHILLNDTYCGRTKYPFYVDPTRRVNNSDVALLNVEMQHFSWVRSNIERKIRNSSAKDNIEKSTLYQDYLKVLSVPDAVGMHIEGYDMRLVHAIPRKPNT